jgi:hypothetical protein
MSLMRIGRKGIPFGVEMMSSRRRSATPSSSNAICSPYRRLRVRRGSVGVMPRSRIPFSVAWEPNRMLPMRAQRQGAIFRIVTL